MRKLFAFLFLLAPFIAKGQDTVVVGDANTLTIDSGMNYPVKGILLTDTTKKFGTIYSDLGKIGDTIYHIRSGIQSQLVQSADIKLVSGKNLFDTDSIINNALVSSGRNLNLSATGAKLVTLPVTAGLSYTVSGMSPNALRFISFSATRTGTAIGGGTSQSTMPVTRVAPVGSAYLRVTIKQTTESDTVWQNKVQIEQSGTATPYSAPQKYSSGILGRDIAAIYLPPGNIVSEPLNASNAVNLGFLNTFISSYYLKTQVDSIVNPNRITGNNSDFSGAGQWAAGTGSPTFDIGTTTPGKMTVTFTSGNQSVTLPGTTVIGSYYRIIIKAKKISGTDLKISLGVFTTGAALIKPLITPSTSQESVYSCVVRAIGTSFNIGVLSANNTGGVYQFDSVKCVLLNDADLAAVDFTDIRTFGAAGDGQSDDTQPFVVMSQFFTDQGVSNRTIKIQNGTFKVTNLVSFTGFGALEITGRNGIIKSSISGGSPKYLFSIQNGGALKIDGLKIDINNDANLLHALHCENLTGTVSILNSEIYNFTNVNQRGIYMKVVTHSPTLGLANYIPPPLIQGCKIYNPQQVNIPSYDYTNSTFKGCGIELDSLAEYVSISQCGFYGLSIGVQSTQGANSTIQDCKFIQCDPSQVSDSTGVVNFINTNGNQGKYTINGCTFNHLFGKAIVMDYANASRESTITNCFFIVNSFTAITLKGYSKNTIVNNTFQRENEQQSLTGFPYVVGDGVGIELINSSQNGIQNNIFDSGMKYGIRATGTSDKNIITGNRYLSLTSGLFSLTGASNVTTPNYPL